MRILPDIYLVGGGKIGFSAPCDCNIYLIDGHSAIALIDSGSGIATDQVLENIVNDGFDPKKIKEIIITHAHADHAGGAYYLAEATNSKILAPEEDIQLLASGTDQQLGLDIARNVGIYPKDYIFPHCSANIALKDDDTIVVGLHTLHVLHTPGHSRGSTCYFVEMYNSRCIFSGDVIAADGIFHFNSPDVNLSDLQISMNRLMNQQIDSLLPGHGLFVMRGGSAHIKKGWDNLQNLTFEKIAAGNLFLEPRLKNMRYKNVSS